MFYPLPRRFFEPTADVVAPLLLGHYLVRSTPEGLMAGLIVETEAYISNDPACHAYKKKSARNQMMWEKPGTSYIYLIYGFYYCFNAVCRPQGIAEAVLVRAVEPTHGVELMRLRRPVASDHRLTSGPGKLCLAMSLDRNQDGVDLCDKTSPLYIGKNPDYESYRASAGPIVTTTRIGITQAADWPLRYYLDDSAYVSKRVPRKPR